MHYRMTILLLAALLIACFSNGTLAKTPTDDLLQKANDYLGKGQYYLALREAESVLGNRITQEQQSLRS